MKIAVFSDVHGNLPALAAFIAATRDTVNYYICLGDVVGYGPDNDECLDCVWALPHGTLLQGNHEKMFRKGRPKDCSALAEEFFWQSYSHFTHRDLLAKTYETEVDNWRFLHTFRKDGHWLYLYGSDNLWGFDLQCDCFIGHTHHQKILYKNGHKLVNCGSVGQNREDPSRVCYATLQLPERVVGLCSMQYDLAAFIERMRVNNYPQHLIDYYSRRESGRS